MKKQKVDTDQVASELSESALFSGHVGKPTKPQVGKYTTHLEPATIRAVKGYAFAHDLKDYEVVQLALDEFFERHQ